MCFATRANCDADVSRLRQVAVGQGAKTFGNLTVFISFRRCPHHPRLLVAVRFTKSRQYLIHRLQIFNQLSQSLQFTTAKYGKFAGAKRIWRGPAAEHTVIDAEFRFFPAIEVGDVILIHLRVELDWGVRLSRFPIERPASTFWAAAGLKLVSHISPRCLKLP